MKTVSINAETYIRNEIEVSKVNSYVRRCICISMAVGCLPLVLRDTSVIFLISNGLNSLGEKAISSSHLLDAEAVVEARTKPAKEAARGTMRGNI